MLLRMKVAYAGPAGQAAPGQTIEVSDAEGSKLIGCGYAELVDPPKADKAAGGERDDTSLEDLDLSDGDLAALAEHDPPLLSVGDVVAWCEEHELTEIAGIGKAADERIRAAVGMT